MSVVTGFYRTCVIDTVLEHSPAEYARRPTVPSESPTLGLSHLQFEALLTAARESANRFDFALVAMLGLLGLRVFEACAADISDVGEEHGTAFCAWSARAARAARSCWCRCHRRSGGQTSRRVPGVASGVGLPRQGARFDIAGYRTHPGEFRGDGGLPVFVLEQVQARNTVLP
jgi:integrase